MPEGKSPASLAAAAVRQLLLPALVGCVTGTGVGILAGLFEDRGLDALSRAPAYWAVGASAMALILTYAVGRAFSLAGKPSGSELYIQAYLHPGEHIPAAAVPGRIAAAISTVGLGGSQGFEAASALLGSALGDAVGRARRLALPLDANRALMAAGASAGIAAVFSSPAVGLLYGLEVPYKRDIDARPLVPAAVASACAYGARIAVAGAHPLVELRELPAFDLNFAAGCIAVGVACGLGGRIFAAAQAGLQRLGRSLGAPWRVASASALFALLAWAGFALSGSWITLGPGHIAAHWLATSALAAPAWLVGAILLIRTAGTLVCVYGGGGGGVFTALACTGLFIGELTGRVVGHGALPLSFIGAACFLSAGYRIPLSCMLWLGEASGDLTFTLGGAVAVALTQVFCGDASVSEAKRESRAD